MMTEYQARFLATSIRMLNQWGQQKSPITGIQVPGVLVCTIGRTDRGRTGPQHARVPGLDELRGDVDHDVRAGLEVGPDHADRPAAFLQEQAARQFPDDPAGRLAEEHRPARDWPAMPSSRASSSRSRSSRASRTPSARAARMSSALASSTSAARRPRWSAMNRSASSMRWPGTLARPGTVPRAARGHHGVGATRLARRARHAGHRGDGRCRRVGAFPRRHADQNRSSQDRHRRRHSPDHRLGPHRPSVAGHRRGRPVHLVHRRREPGYRT